MFKRAYWLFAYLGMMVVAASFLMGFRYSPDAPASNYVFNIVLYGVWVAVHIVMTMPGFKRAVYGSPGGTPLERISSLILKMPAIGTPPVVNVL